MLIEDNVDNIMRNPHGARHLSRQAGGGNEHAGCPGPAMPAMAGIPILYGVSFARRRRASPSASWAITAWARPRCCKALMGLLPATRPATVPFGQDDVTAAGPPPRPARAGLCAAGPGDLSRRSSVLDNLRMGCAKRRAPRTTHRGRAGRLPAPEAAARPRRRRAVGRRAAVAGAGRAPVRRADA